MYERNAQSSSPQGEEGRGNQYPNFPNGQGGSSEASGQYADFGERVSGVTGPWRDYIALLTGGILGQLIQQAEGRLANAQACIEWYEEELKKAQAELDYFRQLKVAADRIPDSDD